MGIQLKSLGQNQAVILRRVLQGELKRLRNAIPYSDSPADYKDDLEDVNYLLSQLDQRNDR